MQSDRPVSDVVPADRFVGEVIELCAGARKGEGVVHLISAEKTGIDLQCLLRAQYRKVQPSLSV